MSETVGLYLDRLELPRALIRREPYLIAVVATESPHPEVRVQTRPFEGVKRGRPMTETIELLPPCDPGSFIAAHVTVMESDADSRRAGEVVDGLRHALTDTQLGRLAVAGLGVGSLGIAGYVAQEAAAVVLRRLAANGDDVLGRFDVSAEPGEDGWSLPSSFVVENDRCRLTLRVDQQAKAADEFSTPRRWADVKPGQPARMVGEHEGLKHVLVGEVVAVVEGKRADLLLGVGDGGAPVNVAVSRLSSFETAPLRVDPAPSDDVEKAAGGASGAEDESGDGADPAGTGSTGEIPERE